MGEHEDDSNGTRCVSLQMPDRRWTRGNAGEQCSRIAKKKDCHARPMQLGRRPQLPRVLVE